MIIVKTIDNYVEFVGCPRNHISVIFSDILQFTGNGILSGATHFDEVINRMERLKSWEGKLYAKKFRRSQSELISKLMSFGLFGEKIALAIKELGTQSKEPAFIRIAKMLKNGGCYFFLIKM